MKSRIFSKELVVNIHFIFSEQEIKYQSTLHIKKDTVKAPLT